MDRRRYLRSVVVVAGVGIAGCSDSETPAGGSGSPTDGSEPSPTSSPEPTDGSTDSPAAASTETGSPTPTATSRPDVAAEVAVGPGGSLRFSPVTVTVETGETVRWVWDSSNHNVKPADVPAESDWTGSEGDRGTTQQAGHVHTHVFEVAGEYDYVCVPHESAGMTGTVVVE